MQKNNTNQRSQQSALTYIYNGKSILYYLFGGCDTVHIQVNINKHFYIPSNNPANFSDRSRTERGVASSFCVFVEAVMLHRLVCSIGADNSVLQAEFFAIQRALEWSVLLYQFMYFQIYGDSLFSLQEIFVHWTKHPLAGT